MAFFEGAGNGCVADAPEKAYPPTAVVPEPVALGPSCNEKGGR